MVAQTPSRAAGSRAFIHTSVVLQRLHNEAPSGHFTLYWLMGHLRKRSFGMIMLLLALVAMVPGISIVAGLLLMIPAFQMLAGRPAPFEATKRLVGIVVMILSTAVVFAPVPLSNVVPALLIALISLAYLEEDGLLLSIALLGALIVVGVVLVTVWEIVVGAKWFIGLW